MYYNLSIIDLGIEYKLLKSFTLKNEGDVAFKFNLILNNYFIASYISVLPDEEKKLPFALSIDSSDTLQGQAFSSNPSQSSGSGEGFLEAQETRYKFLDSQNTVRDFLSTQDRVSNNAIETPLKITFEYLIL